MVPDTFLKILQTVPVIPEKIQVCLVLMFFSGNLYRKFPGKMQMIISAEKDYNTSINTDRRCTMPEITDFTDIYQEIARETNPETAEQIHRLFKWQR